MRRIPLALALVGAVAVTACTSGSKAPAGTNSDGQEGVAGVNYIIKVVAPAGGAVTSVPAGINCSTAVGAVCSATFAWTQEVVLSAVATAPNVLVAWAGDCEGSALTCTLNGGADKTVVAVYGAPGSGHPNYTAAAVHVPAYNAWVANPTGAVLKCDACHGPTLAGNGIAPSCGLCHTVPPPPGALPKFVAREKTGLVATVGPVNGAVVTFTLKDSAGANVDVSGADGKNLPMPVTMGIMNFATDANGNALPYKSATGGNPGTVSPYAALTSMSVTSGTWPSATDFRYPEGSLTKGGVACTFAAPCTCAASPNNCTYSGTVGFGFRTVAPATVATYGACSAAAPCTCATATPCGPALPTTNGPGMLTRDATTGVYTYTFAADPYAGALPAVLNNNTWTVWLASYRRENLANYLDGMAYTAANVEFNFSAITGLPLPKRDIVSDAACAKCHDGFKAPDAYNEGFHSSARIGAGYCNVCHYEGRGTNGFADSATFVHRIHAGKDLTKVTSGTATTGYRAANPYYAGVANPPAGSGVTSCSTTAPCTCTVLQPCSIYTFHGIVVTYPQDPRNCSECHDSSTAAKATQYMTHPTIAACGSCHDQIATTFLPVGTAVTTAGHTGGAGLGNASCAGCHDQASIVAAHEPVQAPASDSCYSNDGVSGCNTNTNAGYIAATGVVPVGADTIAYDIVNVTTWNDAGKFRPQMTFRVLQNGTPVDFGTYAAGTKEELITGFIGGPSIYWVWAVAQDGIAAPADFNASTSNWLKQCWQAGTNCNLTFDAATSAYTIQNKDAVVAANAVMLTGGIGYSYNMNSALPLTQVNLAKFPAVNTNVTQGTVAFGAATPQTCTAAAPCVVKVGGLVVTTDNAWKVATGFTARRNIVDNAKCNACHGQLGVEPTFHAGQRNDGPSCSWCHTPNRTSSGWSANASTFVHGIHGSAKRTVPFNWHAACQFGATFDTTVGACVRATVAEGPAIFYPHVEYPGMLRDCTQCHVAGAVNFGKTDSAAAVPSLLWTTMATGTYTAGWTISPNVTPGVVYGSGPSFSKTTGAITAAAPTTLVESPIAAACSGCHTSDSAKAHMANGVTGGALYQPRGPGFVARTEGCLDCHGKDKIADVEKMHY